MKDSIKTKSFVYVYLVILSCLSILISCGCKENSKHIPNKRSNPPEGQSGHIPNKGSNTPEEQPTAEALKKLYYDIGFHTINAACGIDNYLKDKSRLNKSKEELYRLRSENKITEEYLEKEKEPIDRKLEELEEKQKKVQEEFSTKIRRLSLENPKIKLSKKYLDMRVKIIRIWREAEETTEGKEAYQKIEDELQKHFDLVE
jgi:hypothetical protein